MATPASACRALQRRATQSFDTTFRISNSDVSGKQSLYPDGDPDRHQNLPICSLTNCRPSLKISCKSVRKFLSEVANRQKTDNQTDRQTNNDENITSLAEVKRNRKRIFLGNSERHPASRRPFCDFGATITRLTWLVGHRKWKR